MCSLGANSRLPKRETEHGKEFGPPKERKLQKKKILTESADGVGLGREDDAALVVVVVGVGEDLVVLLDRLVDEVVLQQLRGAAHARSLHVLLLVLETHLENGATETDMKG